MKINNFIFGIVVVITIIMINQYCYSEKPMYKIMQTPSIHTIADIKNLFAYTPEAIAQHTKKFLAQAEQALQEIIVLPPDKRTWENTPKAFDIITANSHLSTALRVFYGLTYVHPDKDVRDAAQNAVQTIEHFMIDHISNNKELYEAFKEYAQTIATQENLSESSRYFIKETLDDFVRSGLALDDEKRQILSEKKKQLADLVMQFDRAIADDQTKIRCTKQELDGVDEQFLAQLPQEDGLYILGMDYPTYFSVIEYCRVEETRKKISQAFANRAYPENEDVLKKVIALRDEIAVMVGFDSFADYDLADQMVHTSIHAESFIDDLIEKAQKKIIQECELLKNNLPSGVTLNEQGLIKPWDLAFIISEYKKNHYALDERIIAEYFPMESTIDALLDIYRQFLSIDFTIESMEQMWHSDVQLISVYTRDRSQLLGYLLLDMYPRPFKYSHAAHLGIVPALRSDSEARSSISVGLVMANFPRSTAHTPSLLKRADVQTFFHEFGHALHYVLGATTIASYAGTNVKRDFVELPSQMLEEWLYDPVILKKVSSHYKTQQPLPDALINTIVELKQLVSGLSFVQRQAIFSKIALAYFAPGADKDPHELWESISKQYTHGLMVDPESHFYCSFGHLTGYGAKYYGYLWSKVFALDLFDTIKQHGLLDPIIGKRYVDCILAYGGSKDPNELLKMFLGREPNNKAFLKDLGL